MNPNPIIDFKGLAAIVKGHREMKGLTLREAAEQSGVSAATLSRIERAEARPDLDTVQALVKWTGVPIERVVTRSRALARAVPRAGQSTLENVEVQFRADPELDPEAAEQLIKLVRQAYGMMVTKREGSLP
jgi:transcriptional regulator with XRE-family HTH domain